MDTRKKPRDFIAVYRNLTEDMKKSRVAQIKWLRKYECLLEEYKKLERELNELYEERSAGIKDDVFIERERTCLPIPMTTSGEYGWLAKKPEFRLEKYGSCVVNYPDPLRDIVFIQKDVPVLAAGKGLF